MEMRTLKTDRGLKDTNELEFVIFCIESIAKRLGKNAKSVYQALTEQSDILKNYIIPEYEILHTQGKEYIIDDILEFMNEKGVEI